MTQLGIDARGFQRVLKLAGTSEAPVTCLWSSHSLLKTVSSHRALPTLTQLSRPGRSYAPGREHLGNAHHIAAPRWLDVDLSGVTAA